MSFMKKFAGAFVELDETPQPTTSPTVPTNKSVQPVMSHPVVSVTDSVSDELRATLAKIIAGRKTPYTALVEASDRMKTVIPDETTRIKAAFTMIAGDGQRSATDVLQAIDVHLADVEGELMRFKATSEAALKTKVGSLRASAEALTRNNESRHQQISALEAQIATQRQAIADDTAKHSELVMQADAAEADINSVAAKFAAIHNEVKVDLANKKTQLSSIL